MEINENENAESGRRKLRVELKHQQLNQYEYEEKHQHQRQPQLEFKESSISESALYEVICPAVYVIRVFGLAPYVHVKDSKSRRLEPSNVNCVFSIIWMSIYSYIVVTNLMRFGGVDRDKPVLGVTENGKLILNYIVAVLDLALCIYQRKEFVKIWNGIEKFDESFGLNKVYSTAGEHKRYNTIIKKTRFWVWNILILSVIGWTSVNQLGMHAFNESYLQNVGYMITYVGTCIAVCKFCGIVFLLAQRFAYLNDLILKQHDSASVKAFAKVKKIEISYCELLSKSERLNEIYSWSILLFLFNLFCHAVSNMYFFIIWTIVDPRYLNNPKVVFCEFSWLIIYLVQLLLLHVACHYVSQEANRMAQVLLDWRRHADRLNKQNQYSSTLHFLNRRLNFTAADCFNVNLPLLTSTFGHLTTYLVILLQLPSNNSSDD